MINNNPGGRLWVDPDGVEGLGQAYDGHVQMYETYLAQLLALRSRYANAWGDDDMGKQFSTKFLEGMDNLEAIIGGVKGTLNYTAAGLKESGRAYREADEDAAEVTHKMATNFDNLQQPLYGSARATEREALTATEGESRGELRQGRLLARKAESAPLQGELRPMERLRAQRAVLPTEVVAESTEGIALERRAGALLQPVEGIAVERRAEAVLRPTERLRGELRTGVALQQPAEARVETGELRGVYTSHRPAHERGELQPLLPAEKNVLVDQQQGTPMESLRQPAMRAMPAISSYFMQPEYATAYVGGQPLPPEYRLISLNPFEDGSTRVDANLYDSITPVTSTPVTTPDGTPIAPDRGQLFVVKENPHVDPTVPGYEPLLLSYSPDGTPTPIFLGA